MVPTRRCGGGWTGFPVRGGSLRQQDGAPSRLFQNGLLSSSAYDQAHRLLAAEAAPQRIPGTPTVHVSGTESWLHTTLSAPGSAN
jgi:hypothetical protein